MGTYTYPALPNTDPRPHAVTGISFNGGGSATYTYDNNGNMTGGDGRTMTWTSFDKPASINKNGNTRDFYYGPDRSRYKQVHNSTPKHYIEDSLVTVNDPGGTIETWEMTVFANGQAVAVVKDEDNSGTITKTTKYLHRDHLGSITSVTDLNGSTLNIESLSYDAFGKRRDATDWVEAAVGTPSLDRGYTGHEHLDDVDVIHMNGRIYDPTLGRMLSPDPVVQAPTVGQNYNRYSYVLNNPLKYTDPSGYFFGSIFKAIKSVAKAVVIGAVSSLCGAYAPACAGAIHGGITAAKGGDVFKIGVSAALGAASYAGSCGYSDSCNFSISVGYSPGGGNRQSPSSRPGSPGDSGAPAETITPLFTIGTGGSSPDQNVAIGQATDVTSVNASDLGTQPTFPNPPVVNNGETSGGLTSATQRFRSAGSVFTGNSIHVAQSTDALLGNLSDAGKLDSSTNVVEKTVNKSFPYFDKNGNPVTTLVTSGQWNDSLIDNVFSSSLNLLPVRNPSNIDFFTDIGGAALPGPDGLQSRTAVNFIVPYNEYYDVVEVWKYGPGRYDAEYIGTKGDPTNYRVKLNYERASFINKSDLPPN